MTESNEFHQKGILSIIIQSAEDVSHSKERAVEYLKEEGVAVNAFVSEGMKRIKRIQLEVKAEKSKKEMGFVFAFRQKAREMAQDLMNSINFHFPEFVVNNNLSLHNNNLETLSEEDIRNTLTDYFMMKLADEQDKK
jgi:anion-transporting  ArsA/GET3 family ATPase